MTCWQVRNGFLSVRVWFPAVAGVLTSGDQEVIIMCKPPAPATPPPASSNTLGEEEGSVRVAGQLDTPSRRLSYEVALYSQLEDGEEEGSSVSGAVEIGGDMIMSIMCSTCLLDTCCTYINCAGTLLQLRVKVAGVGGEEGAWRGVALLDLVLSPRYLQYSYLQYLCLQYLYLQPSPAPPSPAPRATWCWWLAAAACRSSRTWCRGRPAPCRAPSSRPGPRPS